MKTLARIALALALAASASLPSPAQSGQNGGDVPTLTTDDVRSPESTVAASSPALDRLWARAYESLAHEAQIAPGDVDVIKQRIEGGGEIGIALRLELSPSAVVERVVVERNTGIASLDRTLFGDQQGLLRTGYSLGNEFAGFREISMQASISKVWLRFSGTGEAPSVARAIELERQGQAYREQQTTNADTRALVDSVSLTRDGARLTIDVNLSLAKIAGRF